MPKRRRFSLVAALAAAAATLALPLVATAADDYLDTPFTAEQIRDAWRPGFAMTTRMTLPQGERVEVTEVVDWSPEAVTVVSRPVDPESGEPAGEEVRGESAWSDLRDHARFPAERASRERHTMETRLGQLEGWLYEVEGEEGGLSTFFFADEYPGPPIEYRREVDGEVVLEAVVTEVVTPSP